MINDTLKYVELKKALIPYAEKVHQGIMTKEHFEIIQKEKYDEIINNSFAKEKLHLTKTKIGTSIYIYDRYESENVNMNYTAYDFIHEDQDGREEFITQLKVPNNTKDVSTMLEIERNKILSVFNLGVEQTKKVVVDSI